MLNYSQEIILYNVIQKNLEEKSMLKRRILVSCLLILTLVFSTVALGSCDVIKGFFGDHGTTETPDDNGGNETPDIDRKSVV